MSMETVLREVLTDAVRHALRQSPAHAYRECHVCGHSWWPDEPQRAEKHNRDCWVPRAARLVGYDWCGLERTVYPRVGTESP